jgi:hypothetical protein
MNYLDSTLIKDKLYSFIDWNPSSRPILNLFKNLPNTPKKVFEWQDLGPEHIVVIYKYQYKKVSYYLFGMSYFCDCGGCDTCITLKPNSDVMFLIKQDYKNLVVFQDASHAMKLIYNGDIVPEECKQELSNWIVSQKKINPR